MTDLEAIEYLRKHNLSPFQAAKMWIENSQLMEERREAGVLMARLGAKILNESGGFAWPKHMQESDLQADDYHSGQTQGKISTKILGYGGITAGEWINYDKPASPKGPENDPYAGAPQEPFHVDLP